MHESFHPPQWKDRDNRRQDSTDQRALALIGQVPALMPADPDFISICDWDSTLRYAVQRSGSDDYEVADDVGISHSYMSKVLKGTAGLWGNRLVRFMRVTKSIAPLQWLAAQVGCEVVVRDRQAVQIAELERQLQLLRLGRA